MAQKDGKFSNSHDGYRSRDAIAAATREASMDHALQELLKAIAEEPVPARLRDLADQLQRKLDENNGQGQKNGQE